MSKSNQTRRSRPKGSARAESERLKVLSYRTDYALSLRRVAAKNPSSVIRQLKADLEKALAYMHKKEQESQKKSHKVRYGNSINMLRGNLARLNQYDASLIAEADNQRRAKIQGLVNRKLMSDIAERHNHGTILGRTKIVEYSAPGSTLWATSRKGRK